MLEDLDGQVAVVTGGARGIGFSLAGALARLGVHVALLDLLPEVTDSAGTLAAAGVNTLGLSVDVTSEDALATAFAEVSRGLGSPAILVNAAGITIWEDSLEGTKASWSKVIEVNLTGTYLACQAFGRVCRDAGHGGAIVNVSSTAGQQGVGGLSAYVAAKHGLEGLTKVAALDYGDRGVRVNAVAPGPILTDNLVRAGAPAQEAAAAAMPLQRVGRPEEVAAAVVWLCSDDAAFVTGSTLVIDGGKLAGTPPFQVQLRAG